MFLEKEYQRAYRAAHKETAKIYQTQYRKENKEASKAYQAQYREKLNKEAVKVYQARYREENKESIRCTNKKFYEKNKEEVKRKVCAYQSVRTKNDPGYRMRRALRQRIRQALRGENKSARTLELVGCTIEFLRAHLEKQFVPGMTWENYGPVWHVDHILPCAEFHLQHSEEQEVCFHWTNLQPLFAADNLIKSDKII